ncbi:VWA domain-containing protein [Myxococcota bacterium]|nr:VWA domain-containing protein [Myxococcota bacterium]
MTFWGLSATAMAQLAALFGGLVFLLYMLKLRERLIPVSAHFLWDRVIKAGQRSLLARILRRVFSFLLQMLILGSVVITLGDPRAITTTDHPDRLVLLLDDSASMRARDVPHGAKYVTRWENAVEKARELILSKRDNDEIMLVTFSSRASSRTSWETDAVTLLSSLEKLSPTDMPGDLTTGLTYAQEVLSAGSPGKVILFTDSAAEPEKSIFWGPVPEACDVEKKLDITGMDLYHVPLKIDPRGANLAITQLAARPLPTDPDTGEVLFQAINTGTSQIKTRVDFYVDGNWRESRQLELGGGQEKVFLIRLPLVGAQLEARLKNMDSEVDTLSVDDRAWAVLPRKPQPRMLFVGRENLFLEAALLLLPGTIRKVAPEDYRPSVLEHCMEPVGDPCNLVIFNEFVPESVPPTANQIWVHPAADPAARQPFKVAARSKENLQILWTGGHAPHPIMESVSMKDVNLWGESTSFQLAAKDRPLMQVDARGTVLSLLRTMPTGQRQVAIGFSLQDSDFVLQISFPVFMLNLVNWTMGSTPGFTATYPTGEPREFFLDTNQLKYPDGTVLPISGAGLVLSPPRTGVYSFLKDGEPVHSIAASLLSVDESHISPQPLEISCRTPPVWQSKFVIWKATKNIRWKPMLALLLAGLGFLIMGYLRGAWGAAMAFFGALCFALCAVYLLLTWGYPAWVALMGAAFVLLCVEWWTYHRRITV